MVWVALPNSPSTVFFAWGEVMMVGTRGEVDPAAKLPLMAKGRALGHSDRGTRKIE